MAFPHWLLPFSLQMDSDLPFLPFFPTFLYIFAVLGVCCCAWQAGATLHDGASLLLVVASLAGDSGL